MVELTAYKFTSYHACWNFIPHA